MKIEINTDGTTIGTLVKINNKEFLNMTGFRFNASALVNKIDSAYSLCIMNDNDEIYTLNGNKFYIKEN